MAEPAPQPAPALTAPARLDALRRTGLLDTGPDERFDKVTRLAMRLLRAPASALTLVEPDRQYLKSEVGFPARWRPLHSMPLAYSFCQHVVASGEPVLVSDARTDPRVRDSPTAREDWAVSYLGVPVQFEGEMVGAFCVLDRVPREWTGDEVEILEQLADTLLTAVSHTLAARAAAESRASERRLAVQNSAARILARAPTLEAAATELLDTLCETLGWRTGVFWQVEPDADVLVCAGALTRGGSDDAFAQASRRLVFFPGVGLPGRVWHTGHPAWIPDLRSEPDPPRAAAAEQAGLRGAFALPLLADGAVAGVLELAAPDTFEPDAELLETMSVLAAQIEPFVTRTRAEAEVRRLAAIVESSPDAIIGCTPQGLVASWNHGAEALFGYPAAEAVGRSARFLIPPDRADELHRLRAAVAEGQGVPAHETERLHRDGRRVWVSLAVAPMLDPAGRVVGAAEIARDITGQRHIQDRLRQSEAELRAILSALPDAVMVLDADGRHLRVAPGAGHLLPAPRDQLAGRTLHDVLPPEQAGAHLEVVRRVLATGRKATLEYAMDAPGGEVRLEATVAPMDAASVVWAARDVTARVRAEQQARERQARQAQAQKLEAIGRLAGGVAHDFNNLLTVVRGTVQLAMAGLPPAHPVLRDLRTIDEAGATAAAVAAQLLTFSHKAPRRVDVLDLNEVVSRMVPLLRRLLGEQVELEARLGHGPCGVRADRSQLEQVVMNLAVNARDAMPGGGPVLIETGPAVLPEGAALLPAGDDGGQPVVMLSVTDQGTGMTPEVMAHVFEPFFTTKGPGHGTGLGLATVYDIVRQSGGWVQVESEPGRGTRLRVYLPLAEHAEPAAPAPAAAAGPPPPAVHRAGTRVLLVEDEHEVRRFLRRCLQRAGYEVLEAPTGADALRLLDQPPGPDLVVTDGVLPDMRGDAVVNAVRARLPGVPVLLVSGYQSEDVRVARDVPFMQKPVGVDEFLNRVAALLASRPSPPPDPSA